MIVIQKVYQQKRNCLRENNYFTDTLKSILSVSYKFIRNKKLTMKRKDFFNLAAVIFALAAALHLVRFFKSWDLTIGAFEMPLWASLVIGTVAAVMAFNGWQMGKK